MCHHFQENRSNFNFWPLYNLNTYLWPLKSPNVRTMCRIWKIITFLKFLSQCRRYDILLNKIQALLIFDPLITLWGHFKASYFKMLNDARVASACSYVRACRRVRNSKKIATIRDFHVYIRVNSTILWKWQKIVCLLHLKRFRKRIIFNIYLSTVILIKWKSLAQCWLVTIFI